MRNGIAKIVRYLERQISFVKEHAFLTVHFEFESDHHHGIEGDLDHRIRRWVNRGRPMEANKSLGKN
jgi:hypothetical protein